MASYLRLVVLALSLSLIPGAGTLHAAGSGRATTSKPNRAKPNRSKKAKKRVLRKRVAARRTALLQRKLRKNKVERAVKRAAAEARPAAKPHWLKTLTLEVPKLLWNATRHEPKAFWVEGVGKRGWRHTWHHVKEKKWWFLGGVLGVGAIGAVGAKFGVDAHPYVLTGSLGILGIAAKDTADYIRLKGLKGKEAARVLGERMMFPVLLVNASSVAGFAVADHGGAAAAPSGGDIAKSAAGSAMIGYDSPAVAVQIAEDRAIDKREAAKAMKKAKADARRKALSK